MRALVIVGLACGSACWHEATPTTLDPAAQESSSTRSSDEPAPTTRHFHRQSGPDCFSLVPAMEQIFSRYQAGFGPAMAEVLDAVTSSCIEDVWSLDMIQCFLSAADDKRAEDCIKMLSENQTQSLQRRLMEAMTKGMQSVPPPTPTP